MSGNPIVEWVNRCSEMLSLKRYSDALKAYDHLLKLRADIPEAWLGHGIALYHLSRPSEALASYDRALDLRPQMSEAWINRSGALLALNRYPEALDSADRAMALRPAHPDARLKMHINRGAALCRLRRYEEGLASLDLAVALQTDSAEAHANRGLALQKLGRYDEGLASCDLAISLQPNSSEAHTNRGTNLEHLGRFAEALASYDRAVSLQTDNSEAHFNGAMCRLLLGDFDAGWKQHEWRWQAEHLRGKKRNFHPSQWSGGDIAGRTILLHAEQGFGDTIQFCRYATLVAALGAAVILEVQQPLQKLMGNLAGPSQIVGRGSHLPDFDVHCPLLSLPSVFATGVSSIPAQTPYLRASPEAAASWNKRLEPGQRPRIGLAWSGSPTHGNDQNRSIHLSDLAPLLHLDATFVSLQKELRVPDQTTLKDYKQVIRLEDSIVDFHDTAAIVSSLDLVISVDTSAAHLAGALGKPVWVLLPASPDWRWMLGRDDSPWYPTARLFRQERAGDWDSVIERVRGELSHLIALRRT